jgi:hypothetical protein
MGWATAHIAGLRARKTVQFRPRGNSMTGRVESGQLCTVEPIEDHATLRTGDIVLCKVNGAEYLHLVKAIGADGRFQIGNNKGHINGWVSKGAVYGKLARVDP